MLETDGRAMTAALLSNDLRGNSAMRAWLSRDPNVHTITYVCAVQWPGQQLGPTGESFRKRERYKNNGLPAKGYVTQSAVECCVGVTQNSKSPIFRARYINKSVALRDFAFAPFSLYELLRGVITFDAEKSL